MTKSNPAAVNKPQGRSQSNPAQKEKMLDRFIDLQTKELDIKTKELNLREKELVHNQEYALAALQAQKEDRKENRQTYSAILQMRGRYFCIGLFFVLVFAGSAIYMGKSEIVTEALKVLIPSLASAVGGFFWGKSREAAKKENE